MKFYIPTSSLNLDNILQSESILPASFYEKKNSGYRSFEQIPQLAGNGFIMLFDHPVKFGIEDSSRYNFPMLIELDDDEQCRDLYKIDENIYLSGRPLRITPTNCTLYFFSEKEFKIATVNSRDNKSIKYFSSYRIEPLPFGLDLVSLPVVKIAAGHPLADFRENIIDKQKGVLYAWFLAQRLALDPSLARRLKNTRDLYNHLTALSRLPVGIDAHKLLGNAQGLLDEYIRNDASFLQLPSGKLRNLKSEYLRLRDEISCRTELAVSKFREKMSYGNTDGIHIHDCDVEVDGYPLITIVVNAIISGDKTPVNFMADRKKFCLDIISTFVNELGKDLTSEEWRVSSERLYLNTLFRHISDPTAPFDLHSIENYELASIAVFLLHGPNFINMKNYLIDNEVTDYRGPLLLWGALCGYMEMNVDHLRDILSIDTYSKVYQYLYYCHTAHTR